MDFTGKTILVTGAAGFIGAALTTRLLLDGARVIGLDNLNDYYDVRIKKWRLSSLTGNEAFSFIKGSISDNALVPMQRGDVAVTYAETSALERDFGFKPSTSLREGLGRFAAWYRNFYMEEEK